MLTDEQMAILPEWVQGRVNVVMLEGIFLPAKREVLRFATELADALLSLKDAREMVKDVQLIYGKNPEPYLEPSDLAMVYVENPRELLGQLEDSIWRSGIGFCLECGQRIRRKHPIESKPAKILGEENDNKNSCGGCHFWRNVIRFDSTGMHGENVGQCLAKESVYYRVETQRKQLGCPHWFDRCLPTG